MKKWKEERGIKREDFLFFPLSSRNTGLKKEKEKRRK